MRQDKNYRVDPTKLGFKRKVTATLIDPRGDEKDTTLFKKEDAIKTFLIAAAAKKTYPEAYSGLKRYLEGTEDYTLELYYREPQDAVADDCRDVGRWY